MIILMVNNNNRLSVAYDIPFVIAVQVLISHQVIDYTFDVTLLALELS
jgi:hypothetical protein